MVEYPRGVRPSGQKIQIRFRLNGRDYIETLELEPTKAGLERAARIREDRINALKFGVIAENADLQFFDVCQRFLDTADLAKSTRDSYRDALNLYWVDRIGHLSIRSIRYATLRRIDEEIEWKSPKTRSNVITALRQVFRYAMELDLCDHNPAAKFRVRKGQPPGPDPYTGPESNALLEALKDTYAGFYFTLAFGTGMRTGELLALSWGDWDGKALHVHRSKVRRELKESTKTNIARRVMVGDMLATVLDNKRRDVGNIIVNQYRRPYQSGYHLNQVFRAAHETTGVRLRTGPYPWRHTYASLALTAGLPPAFIARQLGHSLEVLYRVYGRWIPSDDHELANRMEQSWLRVGYSNDDAS